MGGPTVSRLSGRRGDLTAFDWAFVAACVVSVGILLVAGNGMTFFHDEWNVIQAADNWSVDAFMSPYNQHWSLLHFLIYKPMLATVGMQSYVPYLMVLHLVHVAAAAALYAYARARTYPVVALAVGVIFLMLGSAGDNIFMAANIGQTLSVAAGGWALVILLREPTPRHGLLAATLLIVAAASSGIGLFFLAAAAVSLVLTAPRRRYLWSVGIPAVVYATWYLAFSRTATNDLAPVTEALTFALEAMGKAMGQLTGAGAVLGLGLAALLIIAAAVDLVTPGPPRLGLAAGVTGLVTEFVLIGLARAGPEATFATRYVFPAAFFIILAATSWLGRPERLDPARHRWVAVAMLAVFVVALGWNVNRLLDLRDLYRFRADETRAALTVLERYGGTPAIPPDVGLRIIERGGLDVAGAQDQVIIPGSARLARLTASMGSPVTDKWAPLPVTVPDAAVDRLFSRMVAGSIELSPAALPADVGPVTISDSDGARAGAPDEGGCSLLEPQRSMWTADLLVESGAKVYLVPERSGRVDVAVSLHGTRPPSNRGADLTGGGVTLIGVPDVGDASLIVHLDIEGAGPTRICRAE